MVAWCNYEWKFCWNLPSTWCIVDMFPAILFLVYLFSSGPVAAQLLGSGGGGKCTKHCADGAGGMKRQARLEVFCVPAHPCPSINGAWRGVAGGHGVAAQRAGCCWRGRCSLSLALGWPLGQVHKCTGQNKNAGCFVFF